MRWLSWPERCGKTTTLKIFTDLIRSSSGQAFINGFNVHSEKKKALASVAALVETPEIYPSLTPREALTMIAEMRGVPSDERRKRVEESVAEVRMEEWSDKRVGKFSKGMKQRICIASTLLSDPSVLLLDEPTNGLDPRGMSEVRGIVKSLKNKKRLIFMSSHLLAEVSDICDEVAIIDHGKLLVYDTIAAATSKFSGGGNIVDVGLLRALDRDRFDKTLGTIPEVITTDSIDERNLRIEFKGGVEVQAKILSSLIESGIGVVSYRPAASALEDVYLNLVKETL